MKHCLWLLCLIALPSWAIIDGHKYPFEDPEAVSYTHLTLPTRGLV